MLTCIVDVIVTDMGSGWVGECAMSSQADGHTSLDTHLFYSHAHSLALCCQPGIKLSKMQLYHVGHVMQTVTIT